MVYPTLRENYLLRGWTCEGTDLRHCVYDWYLDRLYEVDVNLFDILQKCNGTTKKDDICTNNNLAEDYKELMNFGMIDEHTRPHPIKDRQKYNIATNPLIRNVCWLITGECNLNCKHCYLEAPLGKYPSLNFEEVRKIINEFCNANILSVTLTGGEPFFRKDILDIIRLLTEKKIKIRGFNTNGLLITDNILRTIKSLGIDPEFSISFDGVSYHDYLRGIEGTEKRVINIIRKIISYGFKVSINTCVTNSNKESLIDTYDLLKNIGINAWRLNTPLKMGLWSKNLDEISIEDEASLYMKIFEKWRKDGKPFQIALGTLFRTGKCSGSDPENEAPDVYTTSTPVCNYYKEEVALLPDGRIVPCNGFINLPLLDDLENNNILENDLSSILRSPNIQKFKNLTVGELLESNPECKTCEYLSQCGLGCRICAYTETKNFYLKDPRNCKLIKTYYSKFKKYEEMEVNVNDG